MKSHFLLIKSSSESWPSDCSAQSSLGPQRDQQEPQISVATINMNDASGRYILSKYTKCILLIQYVYLYIYIQKER